MNPFDLSPEESAQLGALLHDLEEGKTRVFMVSDPDLIAGFEALKAMTPEQRAEFDRLRDEWKDAGRP